MARAKNLQAIFDWCAQERPDLIPHYEHIENMNSNQGDGFILIMTSCFEAGRLFQSKLPAPTYYNGPESYFQPDQK